MRGGAGETNCRSDQAALLLLRVVQRVACNAGWRMGMDRWTSSGPARLPSGCRAATSKPSRRPNATRGCARGSRTDA